MRRLLFVGIVLLVGVSPLNLFGQLQVEVQEEFKQANPAVRFFKKENGVVGMIYGKTFSTGSTPLESAINHVDNWQNLFGEDIGSLDPDVKPNGRILQEVMPDPSTGVPKFYTFRFKQTYAGLPVFRSGVGFLIRNTANNPLVMTGFDVKEMQGFDAFAGGLADPQATPEMLENVRQLMDGEMEFEIDEEIDNDQLYSVLEQPVEEKKKSVANVGARAAGKVTGVLRQMAAAAQQPPAIEVSDEQLVIWAGINNVREEPQLAVSFIAERGSVQTYPDYHKYLIVASVETGELLLWETQIHNVDVQGTVSGRATDGLGSLECHPEASFGLPYAEVSISGGNTAFADENGDFVIPHGGSTEVTVTSRLRGQWFEVFDQAASNSIPEISMQVTPPGPADFLHNPTADQEFSTANVNAYLESNVVRDYVLSYEPAFPIIDTQQFFNVNTNLNSTCNAFYNGSSINFYARVEAVTTLHSATSFITNTDITW